MSSTEDPVVQDPVANQLADMGRLHDLSTRLSTRRGLRPVLREVLTTATSLQNTDKGMLMLYDPEGDDLQVETSIGLSKEYLDWVNRPGKASCRLALEERHALIIEDVEKDARFARPTGKAHDLGAFAVPTSCRFWLRPARSSAQ